MSSITVLWSTALGACLTMMLVHLFIWSRDRRSWANLCFSLGVLCAIGLLAVEMVSMKTDSPAVLGVAFRWAHCFYGIGVGACLVFVHLYFGTGRGWLLGLALGLRLCAVVANFTTGQNLHVTMIHSLREITFLGEQVSVLGEWTTNPWVRLGQLAAFFQLCYVVDASIRLWRTGSAESRQRALTVGGSLSFFVIFAATSAALVANGVLQMPFIVSFPFLGMVLAMGYELSSDVLRAARVTQKLRESELRADIAAEAAKFGIWCRDLERDEIWASDEWRAMFGFERSEPLNIERFLERLHPEDREAVLRVQTVAIEGGGIYETEYRILFPDGRMRWIGSRGRVEFDKAGKAVLIRGASLDITARKQAEQETLLLRQEVAHVGRVSMMGQLASSLAHEINQPLGAILRNAEAAELFLQDASPDLSEIRAILADIRKDDQRAGAVIERMRTMLKRQTLDTRALDVGDLIHEVTTLAHGDALARKVKLEVDVPDRLLPVRGDRVHLQQVLLNLILNGMDALNGASPQDRRVAVRARLNGEQLIEIGVSDRGPGIRVEELTHIFEPFFTTKPTGMGMGLPISRTIVEAHGGDLWVTNNEDRGVTFRFTLKIAEAEAS